MFLKKSFMVYHIPIAIGFHARLSRFIYFILFFYEISDQMIETDCRYTTLENKTNKNATMMKIM